jgi:hypothetical protein
MNVSFHLHAPAALSLGKEQPVPIGKEAKWAKEQVWTRWWREEFLYKKSIHRSCQTAIKFSHFKDIPKDERDVIYNRMISEGDRVITGGIIRRLFRGTTILEFS